MMTSQIKTLGQTRPKKLKNRGMYENVLVMKVISFSRIRKFLEKNSKIKEHIILKTLGKKFNQNRFFYFITKNDLVFET